MNIVTLAQMKFALLRTVFSCSVQHLASKKKAQGTTASFLTIATQLRVSVFCDVKSE